MSYTNTIEITSVTLTDSVPTSMTIKIYDSQGNTETITSDTTTRTNGLTSTEENTRTNFTGSSGNKAKIIHREFMQGDGPFTVIANTDATGSSGVALAGRIVYNNAGASVSKAHLVEDEVSQTTCYANNSGGYGNTYLGWDAPASLGAPYYYFFNIASVAYPTNTIDITSATMTGVDSGIITVSAASTVYAIPGYNSIVQGDVTATVSETGVQTRTIAFTGLSGGTFSTGSIKFGEGSSEEITRTVTDVVTGTPNNVIFSAYGKNGEFVQQSTASTPTTLGNPIVDDADEDNLAGCTTYALGNEFSEPFSIRANVSMGSFNARYSANVSTIRATGNLDPQNGTLSFTSDTGAREGDTITQAFDGTGEGTVTATVSFISDSDTLDYESLSSTGSILGFQPGLPNVTVGSTSGLEISEREFDTLSGVYTENKNNNGDTYFGYDPDPPHGNDYYYFAHITSACLHEDVLIETDKGYIKIADLKRGDLIKTMNSGYIPLARLGKTYTIGTCPYIIFEKDSIEPGLPTHRLMITPGHPMYYNGKFVDPRDFLESKDYPNVIEKGLKADGYYHLVFESHEIFYANGVGVTSLPYNTSWARAYLKKQEFFDQSKFDKSIVGKMEPPYMLHEDPLNPPVDPSRVSKNTVKKDPTEEDELIDIIINNNYNKSNDNKSNDNNNLLKLEYDSDGASECGSIASNTGGGGGGGNLSDWVW